MRLRAPLPGWSASADVVVIGSGVAGLTTALQIRAHNLSVMLITKARVDEGSTKWAQGGIAAALGPGDSPADHERDTLVAGAGLCDLPAVKVLVTEGPEAVRRLIARGAVFDKSETGEIALTREGGHLRNRILHAGGDATGAEVSRALLAAVSNDPGIEVIEHALVLDALKGPTGRVCGVTLHVIGEGTRDGVGQILARAVVLATGGLGQVYSQTTNPSVSTGDGVALALRAGADVADVEFIQFHPTVLYMGENSRGQQPLISEAVRGEGAFLVNDRGERFMTKLHPLADLAPRDVVAKEIARQMTASGAKHVWLDARAINDFSERFPTIHASCSALGIDPTKDLIPVAPASHYASGGIRTDLNGHSSVQGLYAVGETACTGAHGANRLASNSLLEGLVFGARIAEDIAKNLPPFEEPSALDPIEILISPSVRGELQRAMSHGAGVVRSAKSLDTTLATLERLEDATTIYANVDAWETTNLYLLATAIARSALDRTESRGSHWREDHPEPSDSWKRRIHQSLDGIGNWQTTYEEVFDDLSSLTKKIESYGIQVDTLLKLIAIALDEDAPNGEDKTSQAAIALESRSRAEMRARKSGVVAGAGVAAAVFETLGLIVEIKRSSGEFVEADSTILVVSGNTREILLGERTALNFISHLSGIATLTRKWVDEIAGTGAIIRDTRKTTPGLRQLEKFAVRMGGGMNHRMHLSDAAIVKDNHIAAAGSITGAVDRIRSEFPDLQIEVEVDDLTQLKEALTVNADVIMLDNMSLEMTRAAVALAKGSNSKLESSGGISFDRARAYAETGVDYLAIGALTHSAPILDIGLDF